MYVIIQWCRQTVDQKRLYVPYVIIQWYRQVVNKERLYVRNNTVCGTDKLQTRNVCMYIMLRNTVVQTSCKPETFVCT